MSIRIGRLTALFTFLFVSFSLYNFGCFSDNFKLGNNDRDNAVQDVRVYRAGTQITSIADMKVGEHVIIEGRAMNDHDDYARNAELSMTTTDEKILKILNSYYSNNSFFSVIRAESIGTAEILVGSAGVTVPVQMAVNAGVTAARPYILFRNSLVDTVRVGSAVEFTADYVSEANTTKEVTIVWTLLPKEQTFAQIANSGKNNTTVTGLKTGEVDLLARDAENTAAAALHLKIN